MKGSLKSRKLLFGFDPCSTHQRSMSALAVDKLSKARSRSLKEAKRVLKWKGHGVGQFLPVKHGNLFRPHNVMQKTFSSLKTIIMCFSHPKHVDKLPKNGDVNNCPLFQAPSVPFWPRVSKKNPRVMFKHSLNISKLRHSPSFTNFINGFPE